MQNYIKKDICIYYDHYCLWYYDIIIIIIIISSSTFLPLFDSHSVERDRKHGEREGYDMQQRSPCRNWNVEVFLWKQVMSSAAGTSQALLIPLMTIMRMIMMMMIYGCITRNPRFLVNIFLNIKICTIEIINIIYIDFLFLSFSYISSMVLFLWSVICWLHLRTYYQ